MGANLEVIGSLVTRKELWSFSIAGHGSRLFFDFRVRLSIGGNLKNNRFLVAPFFERHTAKNILELLYVILDSITSSWR